MSDESSRQYKRDNATTNPFRKPPHPHKNQRAGQGLSGSEWGLPQLEWLYILFTWSCDSAQLLSKNSEILPKSQLQRSILDALNMSWEELVNNKNLDHRSLYGGLVRLARKVEPLDEYDRSSTIEGPLSQPASQDRGPLPTFLSPGQRQEPSTPDRHFPSSPPPMPASRTQRPNGPSPSTPQSNISSSVSDPPSVIITPTFNFSQKVLKSVSTSSHQLSDQTRSEIEDTVERQDTERGNDEFQGEPNF